MLAVFAILASLALLVPFPLTGKANPSGTSFILARMIHEASAASADTGCDGQSRRSALRHTARVCLRASRPECPSRFASARFRDAPS